MGAVMETIDIRNIKPLTDFRNHIKKYIKELNTTKKPIVLTQHGKSAAIILVVDIFRSNTKRLTQIRKNRKFCPVIFDNSLKLFIICNH